MSNKTYALGQGITPLSYSDDSGLTWQWIDVTLPPVPRQVVVRPFYQDELFITINPGVAGISGLYKSTDAGVSFNPVTLPSIVTGIFKLQYVDNNSLIGIGYENFNPDVNDLFIIRSNDGGTTFTQSTYISTLIPSGFVISGTSVSSFINNVFVYFTDPAEGFIALNVTEAVNTAHKKTIICKTINGGLTWPTTIEIDNFTIEALVASNADSRLLLYMTDHSIPGTLPAQVYTIDDDLLSNPVFIADWSTAYLFDDGKHVFHQVENDPSKVFAIDLNKNNSQCGVLYSSDFGLTWTVKTLAAPDTLRTTSNSSNVAAYDENTLIVQSSGATYNIYRSSDGGANFSDVFDAPSGTGSNRSVDVTELLVCGQCPDGYTRPTPNSTQCEKITLGGPICDPPYFLYGPSGECALPSTIAPSNILYAIDNSSSVSTNQDGVNERQLFVDFINILTDKLSDRLSINSIKVGVVHWSTTACYDQAFTSDKALIDQSVARLLSCATCPGYQCAGTTNHIEAFCTSVSALNAQSIANPAAENVLILFTDGSNNTAYTCDLSSIGLSPIVVQAGGGMVNEFYQLAADAKANLNGKGLKIMICVVGSASERSQVQSQFIDYPKANNLDPYPSEDPDGNYYYYDAGDFTQANSIAQQIILGLGAQFTPSVSDCPQGCEKVPGPDNLGYCQCVDTVPILNCFYRLDDCAGIVASIITDADLQQYYDDGNIIRIVNSDTCWQIVKLDQIQPNPQSIIVDEVFTGCRECLPSSKLFNCADNTNIIYSSTDLSQYNGLTIQLQEFPGECWQVGPNDDQDYVTQPVTLDGTPYRNCEECNPTKYQLTNCLNGSAFIISDSDLSNYINRAIRPVNMPGLCFYVTSPPACTCIDISINDVVYQVEASSALFGGRNAWSFQTLALDNLSLAWSTDDMRWEVFNSNTLEVYAYNTLDTLCPFSSNWTIVEGSTFVVNYVTYCYDEIYDINVEQDFVSCEACVNC